MRGSPGNFAVVFLKEIIPVPTYSHRKSRRVFFLLATVFLNMENTSKPLLSEAMEPSAICFLDCLSPLLPLYFQTQNPNPSCLLPILAQIPGMALFPRLSIQKTAWEMYVNQSVFLRRTTQPLSNALPSLLPALLSWCSAQLSSYAYS